MSIKFKLRKWLGIHKLLIETDRALQNLAFSLKPKRDSHGRFTE